MNYFYIFWVGIYAFNKWFLSSFPFLQKVEDFSVILGSVDKSDLTNMYLKFEIAIIKQVYLIAMEFAEFMQLGLSMKVSISYHNFSMKSKNNPRLYFNQWITYLLQVRITDANNDALMTLCKMNMIFNHSNKKLAILPDNFYIDSFIARNWSKSKCFSSDMAHCGVSKKIILAKVDWSILLSYIFVNVFR